MAYYLSPLLHLQPIVLPAIVLLLLWGVWRTVFRKDPAVGLALYAALLVIVDGFYNTGIYLPGLDRGSIRYSEICALVLLLSRRNRRGANQPLGAVTTLITCYFLLLFVAALRAKPLLAGIADFRVIVIPQIVAFVLARRGLTLANDYRRFLLALTALVMIIGLFSLWDVLFDRWLLHSDMLLKPEYYVNRKHGRFGGMFLNPNFLGAFVVLTFPAIFMLALEERILKVRLYLGVTLLALLFSLVETQSRAPMLALACSIVVLMLSPVGSVSRFRRIGGLGAGLVAFLLVMPGFFEHAIQRFDTIDNETSMQDASRASMWAYAQQIIEEHPLGGVGFGEMQFIRAMERTDFRARFGRAPLDNPHNSYLQAAAYAGIPVVVVFVLLNATLILNTIAALRRAGRRDPRVAAAFGLSIGILGFLLSIYPDMHLFTPTVAPIYWLLFGLLLASVADLRAEQRQAAAASRALADAARVRRGGAQLM